MTSLGIDFGTTNSVVAVRTSSGTEAIRIDEPPMDWANLNFDLVMPTVMAVDDSDQMLFGWAAKLYSGEKLEAVKRLFKEEESAPLGGRTISVEEAATLFFSRLKSNAAAAGIDASSAVVTIPANSRGQARFRTKLCAGMAGLDVGALINEPTAAAMAFSAQNPDCDRLMVVDWGGGTLDVTILESADGVFIEQASKGIQALGGLDFDTRLGQLVLRRAGGGEAWSVGEKAQFRLAVERAKILLSSQEFTVVQLPDGRTVEVSRQEFANECMTLVERVRQPIEQCFSDLGGAVNLDAVVLVGGTCNIPAIRDFISEVTGTPADEGVNPMTAVAEGAAIAAAILSGEASDNAFFVATEHALGTYALDETRANAFSTIIPRNRALPASATETYFPVSDEQSSVLVEVVEGDPQFPPGHPDNVVLKSWTVEMDPSLTIADKAFDITYDYDVDGILHVAIRDRRTGRTLLQDDVSFGVSGDRKKLVAIAKRVDATVNQGASYDPVSAAGSTTGAPSASSSLSPDELSLVQKARTRVVPFLDEEDAGEVREILERIESPNPGDRAEAMADLRVILQSYSYLL